MNTYNSGSKIRNPIAEIEVASPANWNLSRGIAVNIVSVLTLLAVYTLTVSAVRMAMAVLFYVFARH